MGRGQTIIQKWFAISSVNVFVAAVLVLAVGVVVVVVAVVAAAAGAVGLVVVVVGSTCFCRRAGCVDFFAGMC